MTRTGVRGGTGVRAAAAASLALVVAAGVSACGSTPTAPPTTTVQRGSVSTMVSASGSLSSVTSQGLGFANAAKLIELDVKVGDVVKPGQIIGKQDPFSFQQALTEANAQLASAQANLRKQQNDVSVQNAQRTVDVYDKLIDRTRDQVSSQNRLNHTNTNNARRSLDFADKQLRLAIIACKQAKAASGNSMTSTTTTTQGGPPTFCGQPTTSVTQNPGTAFSGLIGTDPNTTPFNGTIAGGSSSSSGPQATASQNYATAKQAYITAKNAYLQAKKTEDVGEDSGRVTIENARAQLVAQQNILTAAATDRPSLIAQLAALVAQQSGLAAQAQRNLNDTVLYAPVGGTVSAITGTVGEYLAGAGSGNTALAPGTNAAIPGVGAAATSDQSGNASSGISATRPGGGSFVTLNNINTFQVVVPFEESDAAKVQPNQKVQVTFDAIPDLERDGTVLSVAPNGVNISGVTNYYATILLTQSDPRLKDGQTAEASVVTNSMDNVLVVPNAAVIKSGGQSFVNVPGPDGKPQRHAFTPGASGDDNTQVLGGLQEGQQILLPQAAAPGAGGAGGGRGGH